MSEAPTDKNTNANTDANPDTTTRAPENQGLQRKLKSRHLTMIAMGGAIGTGLFVASGEVVSTAGPGGAVLAYAIIGAMVYFLMQSLGEMAALIPENGSFAEYARRFVSPSFGFAMGWNYWFNWAVTVATEIVAAGLIMKFWLPDVPTWIWSAIFLVLLFTLNALSVRFYGESEFWFASIKVITVVIFIVLGVLVILGVFGGESVGFKNWTEGEAPFVGGFMGIFAVILVAGFSFQGTEMLGIAAGETENPTKAIPKATRQVFWRILLFYVLAIAIIGFLIPYTDPNLLRSDVSDIAVSPFTLVFEKVGIAAAASVMNAVILTAILSAGNSGLYVSSRVFHALATQGQAPKAIAVTNKHGVPMRALIVATAIASIAFISSLIGDGNAYIMLVNISGFTGFMCWMGIAWTHWRFRRAFLAQGHTLDELPYRAKFFPAGPIIAMVMCAIVIVFQNMGVELSLKNWMDFTPYLGLLVFIALWTGYRLVRKEKMVPLENADFSDARLSA